MQVLYIEYSKVSRLCEHCKITKQNTKCESSIFKIDKRYTAANTNTLLLRNVTESESPAGFERELQNFTVMAWEYYGNEKKQGKPDAMFVIYVLWLKVQNSIHY